MALSSTSLVLFANSENPSAEDNKNACYLWSGLIAQVRVVPRRTVAVGGDWHFENLCESHHQDQVNCVLSGHRIYLTCTYTN